MTTPLWWDILSSNLFALLMIEIFYFLCWVADSRSSVWVWCCVSPINEAMMSWSSPKVWQRKEQTNKRWVVSWLWASIGAHTTEKKTGGSYNSYLFFRSHYISESMRRFRLDIAEQSCSENRKKFWLFLEKGRHNKANFMVWPVFLVPSRWDGLAEENPKFELVPENICSTSIFS